MSASTIPTPAPGQIWRVVDPRFERFVRIEELVSNRTITIRTVIRDEQRWINAPRGHASFAHPSRFHGKRGGYEFVEAIDV